MKKLFIKIKNIIAWILFGFGGLGLMAHLATAYKTGFDQDIIFAGLFIAILGIALMRSIKAFLITIISGIIILFIINSINY